MLPLPRPFSSTRTALRTFLQREIARACQSWGWSICANQGSNMQMICYSSFHPLLDYLPLLSLSLLCFTFTCGLGPLPWVLSNEVSFKSNSSQIAMRGISLIDLLLSNIQLLIMLYSFSQHLWRLLPLYILCISSQHGSGIFSGTINFLDSKRLLTVYNHYQLYPMDLRSALYSMTTCLVPLEFFIVAKVID